MSSIQAEVLHRPFSKEELTEAGRVLAKGWASIEGALFDEHNGARKTRRGPDEFSVAGWCEGVDALVNVVRTSRAQARREGGEIREAALCIRWTAMFTKLKELPSRQRGAIFATSVAPVSGILPLAFDPRPLIRRAAAEGITLTVGPDGLTATPAGILDLKLRELLVNHANEITQALRTSEVLR
jgi:hypothetical protein